MGLGLAHKKLQEFEQAANAYQLAIEIFQERLAPNHHLIAATQINLAGLQESRGQIPEALANLKSASKIMDAAFTPTNPNAAIAYGNWVGTLYRAKQHKDLLPMLDELVTRQTQAFGENNPYLSITLEQRGLLKAENNDTPGALKDLNAALEIYKTRFGPNSPKLAPLQTKIASLTP